MISSKQKTKGKVVQVESFLVSSISGIVDCSDVVSYNQEIWREVALKEVVVLRIFQVKMWMKETGLKVRYNLGNEQDTILQCSKNFRTIRTLMPLHLTSSLIENF